MHHCYTWWEKDYLKGQSHKIFYPFWVGKLIWSPSGKAKMATQFFLQRHSRKLCVDSLVHNLLLNIHRWALFYFLKNRKRTKNCFERCAKCECRRSCWLRGHDNDYAHLDSNILLLSQAKNKVHIHNNFIIWQLGVSSGLSLSLSTKLSNLNSD